MKRPIDYESLTTLDISYPLTAQNKFWQLKDNA